MTCDETTWKPRSGSGWQPNREQLKGRQQWAGYMRKDTVLRQIYLRHQGGIEEWKQGMVEAQYNLALLYHHGRGVTQNDDLAEKWYLQAAEQGHVCAQNNLGGLYEYRTIFLKLLIESTTYRRGDPLTGRHKKYEQAFIQAYKWYAIAASNNPRLAIRNRDKLEPQLTRAELAEAKKLVREWKEQHN